MTHFIERCRVCDRVISQCRCPAPNKPVVLGCCTTCVEGAEPRCPPSERTGVVFEVPAVFFLSNLQGQALLAGMRLELEYFVRDKLAVASMLRVLAERIESVK